MYFAVWTETQRCKFPVTVCLLMHDKLCTKPRGSSFDHRVAKAGRDLWRSSSPTPLLKKAHVELVDQDIQMAFENLQRWRFHNCSGHPVPVHGHPHIFFLCLEGNPCASVCAHWLWSCHQAPLKRALLCPFFALLLRHLHTQTSFPEPPLLQTEQSQLSQLFLVKVML